MAASVRIGGEGLALDAARDIDDFLVEPANRYVARRTFCFWQLGTDTKGLITWGQPTEQDALEMVRSFEAGKRLDEPHVSLVDMRDLGAVDVVAFEVIMRYMADSQSVFERTVRRQALLHGTGAIGAAVAGFYRVVNPAYPVESFSELDAAAEWLLPERASELVLLVGALRGRLVHTPEIVVVLRARFEAEKHLPTAAQAARAMGLSLRTLQRELAEAGTSFRAEAARYRLEKAERLLAGSSLPVKAVAQAVDMTPERLTALFRRAHGVTAEAWRSQFARVADADRD